MRRGLWFVAGAGAGVYAMARVRRLQEALTRDGLHDRWQALTLGARMLRDEVAQGQAEAETQLRERFGLVPHGRPQLSAVGPGGPAATGAPSSRRIGARGAPETRDADREGEA